MQSNGAKQDYGIEIYKGVRMKEITYEDIKKVNKEMTMTDIKGRDYAEVPQKVAAFRKLFPMGTITTDIISLDVGMVVMKAVASVDGVVLGEGLAYEKEGSSFINKTSYIENCQTSAVGRALSFIGLTGASESIASYEEVMNAKKQQKMMSEDEKKAQLKKLLQDTDSDVTLFLIWCNKEFKREIASVDELIEIELDRAISKVKQKEKK